MADLAVGLSGITAARQALDTIGQNIANASTPGYARREVSLSATRSDLSRGGAGSGVTVEAVQRVKDSFMEGRLQAYRSSLSCADAEVSYFNEIEGLLQEPSESGIGALLDEFFNSVQAAAVRPDDYTARETLLQSAGRLADRISTLYQSLVDMREAIGQDVTDAVGQVNVLAESLAENNSLSLQFTDAQGRAPLSLQDQQDQIVAELAELIGAVNSSPGDAMASLLVGSTMIVSAGRTTELAAPADYTSRLTVAGNTGVEIDTPSGRIGGLLELNREVIPKYLSRLDDLADALMRAVNTVHAEGVPLGGGFEQITAEYSVKDLNGDGNVGNDMLTHAGLPFAAEAGNWLINVTDDAGNVTQSSIAVNPATMSLDSLVDALNGVSNLHAVQTNGRLQMWSDSGYKFDFAAEQGTDVAAALGLNAFFTGTGASDISVSAALRANPDGLALARSADSGDNSNALRMLDLQGKAAGGQTMSLSQGWQALVTSVALDSADAVRSSDTLRSMVDLLREQEQATSGVSLDEEAAKLMQYQQMYTACARVISIISKLTEDLANLL